jgi:hypothetical protein
MKNMKISVIPAPYELIEMWPNAMTKRLSTLFKDGWKNHDQFNENWENIGKIRSSTVVASRIKMKSIERIVTSVVSLLKCCEGGIKKIVFETIGKGYKKSWKVTGL